MASRKGPPEKKPRRGSSRYRGVCWCKASKRWRLVVGTDGIGHYIGLFDTEREAALAYDRVARHLRGPDTFLNFPNVRQLPATIEEMRAACTSTFKTTTSSAYRGVCWSTTGKTWLARIHVDGRTSAIGSFTREIDAARAYDRAARALLGDAAKLNFPRDRSLTAALPEEIARERFEARKQKTVSRYRGVYWSERYGTFAATVWVVDRVLVIAHFEDEEDAARAHDRVALHLGRPREDLNFPDEDTKPATAVQIRKEVHARYKATTSSRYTGVSWYTSQGKWFAEVRADGVRHRLGFFDDEHEAARARDRAAIRYQGDAAKLNFPGTRPDPPSPEDAWAKRRLYPSLKPTSRFRGVSWLASIDQWCAQIHVDGRRIVIGTFDDEEDAARAYDRAARARHGARARPNFPAPKVRERAR